jgi:hypothetical protein
MTLSETESSIMNLAQNKFEQPNIPPVFNLINGGFRPQGQNHRPGHYDALQALGMKSGFMTQPSPRPNRAALKQDAPEAPTPRSSIFDMIAAPIESLYVDRRPQPRRAALQQAHAPAPC